MSYDLLSDWYGNDGHIIQFLRIRVVPLGTPELEFQRPTTLLSRGGRRIEWSHIPHILPFNKGWG